MYELFFFGVFVSLVAVLAIPSLAKLIHEYDTRQRKEYSKLQNTRVSYLEEYKREELNAKAAEQKWRKFTTHEAKLLKSKAEADEEEQNKLKLTEVTKYEEKLLAELLVAKKAEVLGQALGQISAELSKLAHTTSFSQQIKEVGKYFAKNNSVREE